MLPAPFLTVTPPPTVAGLCPQDLLHAIAPLFSLEAALAQFEAG
jgi:hypothetical protein